MRAVLAAVALTLFLASPAWSFVFGDTNFSFTGYPDSTCTEPTIPFSFSSEFEIDSFKNEVNEYRECVKRYVDAAELDQKRIAEKIDETVSNFNLFIQRVKNR